MGGGAVVQNRELSRQGLPRWQTTRSTCEFFLFSAIQVIRHLYAFLKEGSF